MLQRIVTLLLVAWVFAVGYRGISSGQIAETDEQGERTRETVRIRDSESVQVEPDCLWMDFAGPEGVDELALPAHDPCLPSQFTDWREMWLHQSSVTANGGFVGARVIIDRSSCRLILQGVRPDLSVEDTYATPVAIGDFQTPTPVGQFLINHVYCYSDVLFFDVNQKALPDLYNGFFAPLLVCDEQGRCERYRDLGIHGFNAAAFPDPRLVNPETEGPVSHGCIRLPDPCAFKASLVRLAGVGPLRRNGRGSYHWLTRPVEVWIVDDEMTLISLMGEGLSHMHRGLKSILNWIME